VGRLAPGLVASLAPFERPNLPFERVNEATLLIQLAPLLIQFAAQIVCGTAGSLRGGAGTINLFKAGQTTPQLGKFLLLLGEFPPLLVDNTHVSLPVTGNILDRCLANSKYRLSSTIEDFQVSSEWRSEHGDAQLAVAVPQLHRPTGLTGFGTQHHLASVIDDFHPLAPHHSGRRCGVLSSEAHTQKQHHPQNKA
jgi:hypothetical protein